MLARILIAALVLAASPVGASPGIVVHARCAAELARDPAHLRTLRAELTRALDGTPAAYTLDVSLVQLGITPAGRDIEVRAELRAFLSDQHGKILWSSTARSTARGSTKDRVLLQRDAVTAAAGQLAKRVRDHARSQT